MKDELELYNQNFNKLNTIKYFNSMNIAVIVSQKLMSYLDLEANIFLLTSKNYKKILKYIDVDFLLIESSFKFIISEFDYALISNDEKWDNLKSILAFAKKMSIPSVYWQTNIFLQNNKIINNFDYIYTSFNYKLSYTKNKIHYLPHATQPKIYHPYRNFSYNASKNKKNIVIEYGNIINENKELLKNFLKLNIAGLNFIDTGMCYSLDPKTFVKFANKSIVKNCTDSYRINLLRTSMAVLSSKMLPNYKKFNIINDLEALSMGVPVLYLGRLEKDDVRKNIALEYETLENIKTEISKLDDKLYQERLSQLCFRKIAQSHTISHRLNQICSDIGLNYNWIEYPMVSLCFATHRIDRIINCIETFKRQKYPNKELIIAFNGPENISDQHQLSFDDLEEPVQFIQSSRERFLGGALNNALNVAKGFYFFKMDDDDYYGENYIYDLILAARGFDIDIFGKPRNNFFQFGNNPDLFKRKHKQGNNFYCNMKELTDLNIEFPEIITGNSIAGKTKFLKKVGFPENCPRHTDTFFFKKMIEKNIAVNFLVVDAFNMIQIRYRDENWHTWKIEEESLKSKCEGGFGFWDAIV
ncbi:MAG: glycosyltransferase [Desulfatiglandaceae bacterium]